MVREYFSRLKWGGEGNTQSKEQEYNSTHEIERLENENTMIPSLHYVSFQWCGNSV